MELCTFYVCYFFLQIILISCFCDGVFLFVSGFFLLCLFVFMHLVHLPAQTEMKLKFILFLISKNFKYFGKVTFLPNMNFKSTWDVLKYLFPTWGHQSCSNTVCGRHIVMLFRFLFQNIVHTAILHIILCFTPKEVFMYF